MKNISFIHYYWGQHGYQKKQNTSGKSLFWFGVLFFSQNWVNLKKHLKLAKNIEKQSFLSNFFFFFWNFGWKTANQTKKIDFPEEFSFYCYHYCPQTRDNSEANVSFMFCFEILWWKCHRVFFLLFFKMKPHVI